MYATLEQNDALAAARAFGRGPATDVDATEGGAGLDLLVQQVCAEAGLWAPDVVRRALRQARGDVPRSVALVRVWAAALPRVDSHVVAEGDLALTRRVSAAFAEVPGGQWLGAAPELGSRLLGWDDDPGPTDPAPVDPAPPLDGEVEAPPTRATCPRVRDLLTDVPIVDPDDEPASAPERRAPNRGAAGVEGVDDDDGRDDGELRHGDDPARTALRLPYDRPTRLGVLARGETAGLVALASLVLGRRREAVLAELTTAVAAVRVPHPRTGTPCVVAEVPLVEADAIVDAEVDGRAGFAIGWGASLGELDRRAVALALLDGAMQADGAATAIDLDTQTVTATVDGSANNGFIEHLRLPHYASFASYLEQVRHPTAPGPASPEDDAASTHLAGRDGNRTAGDPLPDHGVAT